MFSSSAIWRFLGIALLLATLGLLLVLLRPVLSPMFFAMLLAYALDPLVDRFEAVKLPRSFGIAVLLLVAILILTLFGLLVLPAIIRDSIELVHTLYDAFSRLLLQAGPWLRSHGVPVPSDVDAVLVDLSTKAVGLGPSALAPVGDALGFALGGTATILNALGPVLMVPVFSFYFLHDFDVIVARTRELLPAAIRPHVVAMAVEVDAVLAQFVLGQLMVMAIMATLYSVGYSIIGVPLAVPIGVLAGLLSFIPYVGSGLALVFGLLMVVLHFHGWGQLIGVIVVYAIVQALEGFVITPRVVGGKLGLSPVWVLFSLLAFGELFGFVGVMLALPASAVIKVFVMHGMAHYQASTLYTGEQQALAAGVLPTGRLKHRKHQLRRRLRKLADRPGS